MSQTLSPSMRRSVLIAALRDDALRPKGFSWFFGNCDTCAMGLYEEIVGMPHVETMAMDDRVSRIAVPLGLSQGQGWSVFYGGGNSYGGMGDADITPAMVADRLEQIHREITP